MSANRKDGGASPPRAVQPSELPAACPLLLDLRWRSRQFSWDKARGFSASQCQSVYLKPLVTAFRHVQG